MSNQMTNTYRRINHLVSSGGLSVTNSNQRVIKQKIISGRVAISPQQQSAGAAHQSSNSATKLCYICGESLAGKTQNQLIEMLAPHTHEKFLTKLAQLIGEGYQIVTSPEDFVCGRCTNLMNYWDRIESDLKRVRANVLNLLSNHYKVLEDIRDGQISPPSKMLKIDSNTSVRTAESNNNSPDALPRKTVYQKASINSSTPVPAKPQATTTATQQVKTPSPVQQTTSGTQTVQRKTTRMYNCPSCDFKTPDMRLFNNHYDTCRSQMFQCKSCKRTYQNFGLMKQHMIQEHGTPMEFTCSLCHVNYLNEMGLRKHMELTHATNVVVTNLQYNSPVNSRAEVKKSPQTAITVNATAAPTQRQTTTTSTFSCNLCQFTSTDKVMLDDHMRKHLAAKAKPFKCRLCSTRFETREEASVHAKKHQGNFYKCLKCELSFSKRESLLKHYEVHPTHAPSHSNQASNRQQQQAVLAKMTQATATNSTQKLLNDTIAEAVQEPNASANTNITQATEEVVAQDSIQFFACQICSLTFLQENYYRQHMETHHDKSEVDETENKKSEVESDKPELFDEGKIAAVEKDQGDQSGEVDIEGYLEKMHADKGDAGISFNITIPQTDDVEHNSEKGGEKSKEATVTVGIDMPMLDQDDDTEMQQEADIESADQDIKKKIPTPGKGVSMPSLDDDADIHPQSSGTETAIDSSEATTGERKETTVASKKKDDTATNVQSINTEEDGGNLDLKREDQANENREQVASSLAEEDCQNTQEANTDNEEDRSVVSRTQEGATEAQHDGEQQIAIELNEALQAQVEGGQIKFIMHEGGHVLQLDNHIITDADGNQILVQDSEQIQQLLQTVGVLQAGDGVDGESLQMVTDDSGQMVLVQGENNEQNLIDASLLNADGQLVIQQGDDEDDGPHVISEDGRRIPISVSYTADGRAVVQVREQVMESKGEESMEKHVAEGEHHEEEEASQHSAAGATTNSTASGGFFALDEFIPQSESKNA